MYTCMILWYSNSVILGIYPSLFHDHQYDCTTWITPTYMTHCNCDCGKGYCDVEMITKCTALNHLYKLYLLYELIIET